MEPEDAHEDTASSCSSFTDLELIATVQFTLSLIA